MYSKNMPVVLDTNALIRFFTNDMPDRATKVKELLENKKNIVIPEVVFPELEYILTDQYDTSRENLVKIFQFLASQKNIKFPKHIRKAIMIFEKSKLDMADCIIASHALKGELASFDKELLSVEEIKPFWS